MARIDRSLAFLWCYMHPSVTGVETMLIGSFV